MAPVVAVVLGIVLDSISPNQWSRTRFLLGDGSGVTTCHRGGNAQHLWPQTWTPASGSGTSTCHPDSRELSAKLAAREGSGAATCHADAGAGGDRAGVLAAPAAAWSLLWEVPFSRRGVAAS